MDPSLELEQGNLGLTHYLDVIRRRRWIVVGVTAIVVTSAALFSLLRSPTYRATTKIVVGQGNSLFRPGEAGAVQPFTATMSDLVESNIVASRVIARLDLADTPESLLDRVSVSTNPETAVLNVSVEDQDPERARRIAASIGDVFSELVEDRFGRAAPIDPDTSPELAQLPLTATVWDPARASPEKVSPKPVRDLSLAFVLGLVLALLAAFLRDHFDRTLRTRESVERSFGAPVIGQIPFERQAAGASHAIFANGFVAESFRGLRANLQYLGVKRPLRTILVTSALPEQGKTTVTANLAVAIARSGASTIAVECDLRRPGLTAALGLPSSGRGLTSVLVGSAELEECLTEVPMPQLREHPGRTTGEVWLLPSGPLPPNPSELLSSVQMRNLLDRLGESFDYILLDSPPLLSVADALELAPIVDSVVLVVRRSDASTDAAREIRSIVERLDIHLVGIVLTDVAPAFAGYGAYHELAPVEAEPEVIRSSAVRRARR